MSLTEVTGDLFAVTGLDALAHGVNCRGVMGAGIAVEFKRRWPAMFANYRATCDAGLLRLGDILPWHVLGERHWIYNLATQVRPGPCAMLSAIDDAVCAMTTHAAAVGVKRIGMPRVGCGLGALRWDDVRPIVAARSGVVEIVVVSLPEKKR